MGGFFSDSMMGGVGLISKENWGRGGKMNMWEGLEEKGQRREGKRATKAFASHLPTLHSPLTTQVSQTNSITQRVGYSQCKTSDYLRFENFIYGSDARILCSKDGGVVVVRIEEGGERRRISLEDITPLSFFFGLSRSRPCCSWISSLFSFYL